MSEVEITKENFESVVMQATEPVFIDFWAPWCGPCKLMAPVVEAMAHELQGIVVGKVNVDDHPELAQRFNILSIPTFLIFKGGQVVDQFSGSMSKDALVEKISRHL